MRAHFRLRLATRMNMHLECELGQEAEASLICEFRREVSNRLAGQVLEYFDIR